MGHLITHTALVPHVLCPSWSHKVLFWMRSGTFTLVLCEVLPSIVPQLCNKACFSNEQEHRETVDHIFIGLVCIDICMSMKVQCHRWVCFTLGVKDKECSSRIADICLNLTQMTHAWPHWICIYLWPCCVAPSCILHITGWLSRSIMAED